MLLDRILDLSAESKSQAPLTIDLTSRFDNPDIQGTLVRLHTTQGDILLEMNDAAAPATVANFLAYVNAHRYDGTLIDAAGRADPDDLGSVPTSLHAGADLPTYDAHGNVTDINHILTGPLLPDEPAAPHANTRGTVAIDPANRTADWVINLADNGNTGGAVFGTVLTGMDVADVIEALPTPLRGSGNPFAQIPLTGYTSGAIARPNLVLVQSAAVVPEIAGFTVTSSDPHIVAASVSGTSLKLDYAGGGFGSALITVTATDVEGNQATDTFTITIQSHHIAVTADGLNLTSGQAAPLDFGLTPVNGPAPQKTLHITNTGTGILSLGQITVPPGFRLATPPSTSSLGPGQAIDLALSVDTSSATRKTGTLTIPSDDPDTPNFAIRLTADVAYLVKLNPRKATTISFTDADGTVATIRLTGAGSGQLAFAGSNFSPSLINKTISIHGRKLTLLGITLRGTSSKSKLTIDGKRGDGIVKVGGLTLAAPLGTLDGRAVNLTGKVAARGIQSMTLNTIVDADLHIAGDLGRLTSKSITRTTLTASGQVSGLAVVQSITSSTIRAARLGTVTAQSLTNGSGLYAGYAGTGLPQNRSALTAGGAMTSVVLRAGIVASDIAAHSIGILSLGTLRGDPHNTPVGVAAASIASLSGRTAAGQSVRLINPKNAAAVATALRNVHHLGSFTVHVL